VIEEFADREAEIVDRVVDLELDNRALRDTLSAALDGLNHVVAERDRLRASVRRFVEADRP
jgi:hypothetical protein